MMDSNFSNSEIRDFDKDINAKESLVEEAKALRENSEGKDVMREVDNLKRRWKRIGYWESAYEEQLNDEFNEYLNYFYEKRQAIFTENQEKKEALIERAKATLATKNFNEATQTMNQLLDEWKTVGNAGRETDDALWEQFNDTRKKFFDLKHDNYEELKSMHANAKEVKEKLIEEAKSLADSENFAKTSQRFSEMMNEWKAVGSAGTEFEEELWSKFNESRQAFYTRRNAHYEEVHVLQKQHYEEKLALIEEAKAVVSSKRFTRENTNFMKSLSVKWKEIGLCKRDFEDKIWNEFRAVMDEYFNGLGKFNEEKHANWLAGIVEKRDYKQELILKNKQRMTRLENEKNEVLSESQAKDMEAQIEELKGFNVQLEKEIQELDATIAENK